MRSPGLVNPTWQGLPMSADLSELGYRVAWAEVLLSPTDGSTRSSSGWAWRRRSDACSTQVVIESLLAVPLTLPVRIGAAACHGTLARLSTNHWSRVSVLAGLLRFWNLPIPGFGPQKSLEPQS